MSEFIDFELLSESEIESIVIQDKKSRSFCGILYPDSESMQFAIRCLNDLKYKCLYIIHDRGFTESGEQKKVHIHFIIKFINPRGHLSVAKELHIKPNYIQPLSSFKSYCVYMLHIDEPFKEQYLPEEVEGNLYSEFLEVLSKADTESFKVLKILKFIESQGDNVDRSKVLKWVCSNGLYDVYRRGFSIFNSIMLKNDW